MSLSFSRCFSSFPAVSCHLGTQNSPPNEVTGTNEIYTEIPDYSVQRGRGQNFPIFISCRYHVELGPRQVGLLVADLNEDTLLYKHMEVKLGGQKGT